jgi:hypothetical protein
MARWMLREAAKCGLKLGVMGLCTLKAVTIVPGVDKLIGEGDGGVKKLLGDLENGADERSLGPKLEDAVQSQLKELKYLETMSLEAATDFWLRKMVERAAAFDTDASDTDAWKDDRFEHPRGTRDKRYLKLLPKDATSIFKLEDWGEGKRKVLPEQRVHRSVETRLGDDNYRSGKTRPRAELTGDWTSQNRSIKWED